MEDATISPQDGGTVGHEADTRLGAWSASNTLIAPKAVGNRRRRWRGGASISG